MEKGTQLSMHKFIKDSMNHRPKESLKLKNTTQDAFKAQDTPKAIRNQPKVYYKSFRGKILYTCIHIQTFVLKHICNCALGLFTFHNGKSSVTPCQMLKQPAQRFHEDNTQHHLCRLILITLALALDDAPINFWKHVIAKRFASQELLKIILKEISKLTFLQTPYGI